MTVTLPLLVRGAVWVLCLPCVLILLSGMSGIDCVVWQEDPAARVFELASLVAARSELTRILELVESNLENRHKFQLDMLRAPRVAEPVYLSTKDSNLAKLLERAEIVLRQ